MKTASNLLAFVLIASVGCGEGHGNEGTSERQQGSDEPAQGEKPAGASVAAVFADSAELSVSAARSLSAMNHADAALLPAASPVDSGCTWYGPYALKYAASSAYVSAEIGWADGDYGMLRARASVIGPWEKFSLCFDGSGYFIYANANGLWISAELGAPGAVYGYLRARASVGGPWEKFHLIGYSNGTYSWRSAANGLYVSTEIGYPGHQAGMLRARASASGSWEKFVLVPAR